MQQITFEILECTQYYYVSVRQYYCKEDLPLLQNTIVYSYASDLSLPVFGFFCSMVVMDLIGQNRRRQLKICSNERIAKVMIAFECGYGRNPSIKVWIQVACSYFQIYQTYSKGLIICSQNFYNNQKGPHLMTILGINFSLAKPKRKDHLIVCIIAIVIITIIDIYCISIRKSSEPFKTIPQKFTEQSIHSNKSCHCFSPLLSPF